MTTYDNNFQIAILRVLANEGGYSNDPNDPGGETNFGISKSSYPDVDIKNLTAGQAKDIYYNDWWLKNNYNKIVNLDLATKLFDTSVNIGAERAHKILQRCLAVNGFPSIVDDGDFGPMTLQSTNSCDVPTILTAFRGAQANYYRAIVNKHPNESEFLNGWLIRAAQ